MQGSEEEQDTQPGRRGISSPRGSGDENNHGFEQEAEAAAARAVGRLEGTNC